VDDLIPQWKAWRQHWDFVPLARAGANHPGGTNYLKPCKKSLNHL